MPARPHVVAFDVNETITSLMPLQERLIAAGLPPTAPKLWLAQTLRDGFALTVVGEYHPFLEVAASTLEQLLAKHDVDPTSAVIKEILDGFNDVKVHPDVCPAMKALHNGNIRVIALTNSAKEPTIQTLERAGLHDFVERVISVDEVQRWKPDIAPYHHAISSAGVSAHQMALVSVHSWDIMGALHAGLITGWCSRKEKHFPSVMGLPDVSGVSLVEVAEALLHLPPD